MLRTSDEAAFRAAVRAFKAADPEWEFAFEFSNATDFSEYVRSVNGWSKGVGLPRDFVPNTYMVAVIDDEIVGRISIRHRLNAFLARVGGHIGYGVVPSHRRRGLGTLIMSKGLEIARGLGIQRALLTCDEDNEASIRIIEQKGGVFERVEHPPEPSQPTRRYWIDL